MGEFIWSWLLVGTGAALTHWYLIAASEADEYLTKKEATFSYMLTPLYVIAGPFAVAYMIYLNGYDDDEGEEE